MGYIRKEALDCIKNHLQLEYDRLNRTIRSNKYEFKKLEERQKILKRQRGELHEIINYCQKRVDLE